LADAASLRDGVLLAKGLLPFKLCQVSLEHLIGRIELQRLFGPFRGFRKITCLGIGGREGIHVIWILPARQLAGALGMCNSLFAISKGCIGASRSKPGS